ncbi:hypothetical protein GGR56DRAFT_143601 [Xylariaceae sp. FL0804]|nr:hypothetical protein GGR56DRAFT_143601 [Xylariaceae sp. FL0804]
MDGWMVCVVCFGDAGRQARSPTARAGWAGWAGLPQGTTRREFSSVGPDRQTPPRLPPIVGRTRRFVDLDLLAWLHIRSACLYVAIFAHLPSSRLWSITMSGISRFGEGGGVKKTAGWMGGGPIYLSIYLSVCLSIYMFLDSGLGGGNNRAKGRDDKERERSRGRERESERDVEVGEEEQKDRQTDRQTEKLRGSCLSVGLSVGLSVCLSAATGTPWGTPVFFRGGEGRREEGRVEGGREGRREAHAVYEINEPSFCTFSPHSVALYVCVCASLSLYMSLCSYTEYGYSVPCSSPHFIQMDWADSYGARASRLAGVRCINCGLAGKSWCFTE